MNPNPMQGGHTGSGMTSLNPLERTTELPEEVGNFRTTLRDYAALEISLASSLPAFPLNDRARISIYRPNPAPPAHRSGMGIALFPYALLSGEMDPHICAAPSRLSP